MLDLIADSRRYPYLLPASSYPCLLMTLANACTAASGQAFNSHNGLLDMIIDEFGENLEAVDETAIALAKPSLIQNFLGRVQEEELGESALQWLERCSGIPEGSLEPSRGLTSFGEVVWLHWFGQAKEVQDLLNLLKLNVASIIDNRLSRGISPYQWGQLIARHPLLWETLCGVWVDCLRDARELRESPEVELALDNALYEGVLSVIRRVRAIPPKMYRTEAWVSTVKATGLATEMLAWDAPEGLCVWKAPFAVKLHRKNRIGLALPDVLHTWTPDYRRVVQPSPTLKAYLPPFGETDPIIRADKALKNGSAVLRVLRKSAGLLPLGSHPACIYFLLSLRNFLNAWYGWFFFVLRALGYDTSKLHDVEGRLRDSVYLEILDALRTWEREVWKVHDPLVELIFRRTLTYLDEKAGIIGKDGSSPRKLLGLDRTTVQSTDGCRHCQHLAPSQRCVQEIRIKVEEQDSSLRGSGVSVHPGETVRVKARLGTHPELKPVLHPQDDLNLKQISCDEDILARCKIQIFRLVDDKTGKLRDFFAYSPLTERLRQRLYDHWQRFAQLKGLVRGHQFKEFAQGNMVPVGARMPKGGAPGDTLRYPDSMSATEEESLNCLFDSAEDTLVLLEVTRLIAPEVYEAYRDADNQLGEPLGEDTGSFFYCKNYAAPLHTDNGVGPGLCATLFFRADPDDFRFLNLGYRNLQGEFFSFSPRTNSMWSFRGSDIHGTTLPTISGPRRRTRDKPAGGEPDLPLIANAHVAKPKKNAVAAERYARVRESRQSINEFWAAG
ncbi:hypothetical protein NMY22_g9727 [Coprinellus aureogranulatus]|nr:hypothetical protein NMY22_g9727 [Coprinellus aureogranulatus]